MAVGPTTFHLIKTLALPGVPADFTVLVNKALQPYPFTKGLSLILGAREKEGQFKPVIVQ